MHRWIPSKDKENGNTVLRFAIFVNMFIGNEVAITFIDINKIMFSLQCISLNIN